MPGDAPLWVLLICCTLLLRFHCLRLPLLLAMALCWALLNFRWQLDDRLTLQRAGEITTVSGRIAGIPQVSERQTRFEFLPVPGSFNGPERLLVNWYENAPPVRAGEFWTMELRLKPPWGKVNFQGGDTERWLFTQQIGATATVVNGQPLGHQETVGDKLAWSVQRWRQQIGEAIRQLQPSPQYSVSANGLVLALAIADRSLMTSQQNTILRNTGTAHLLAISGLHIALAAVAGFLGAKWLLGLLAMAWPKFYRGPGQGRWVIRGSMAVSAIGALAYAGLAGWQISTQRAAIMALVIVTCGLLSRSSHSARSIVLALVLVLICHPASTATAGFWFSFTAVLILLFIFVPRAGPQTYLGKALLGQAGICIAMVPLSVFWFQAFSPAGFAANLLAIPWVSFTVVPPVLLGVLLQTFDLSWAERSWQIAATSGHALMLVLGRLSELKGAVFHLAHVGLAEVALGLLGALLLMLPRGLPHRWVGLFLIVPLFLPREPALVDGEMRIEVLDVGQGSAIVVQSAQHALLYDTGPGDGGDIHVVNGVIEPALRTLPGHRPDRVIVSHGDLDHAGGQAALEKRYSTAQFMANDEKSQDCLKPGSWLWDGVHFRILHPSSGLPYLKNDSSCVVSVGNDMHQALLAGDISSTIENRLVLEGLEPQQLLLVPHHGSASSSSDEFIAAARPELAIATTQLGNRFGFPRQVVVERYRSSGTWFLDTGACGAVSVHLGKDGIQRVESARRSRNRVWRWPAAKECP